MIRDREGQDLRVAFHGGMEANPPRMEEDHPKWPKWWTPLGEYMGVSLKGGFPPISHPNGWSFWK